MKDWFAWMKTDKLRAAADYTLNGGEFGEKDAKLIIGMLCDRSAELIKESIGARNYGQYYPTNRHGGQWKEDNPVGLVDHYTSGIAARGVLRWFSDEPRDPGVVNSSSHAVIDRDGTLFIVLNPLKYIALHATWANETHIGIEHVNAGLLLRKTNKIYFQDKRTYPRSRWDQVQYIGGKPWEPYTPEQIITNLVFKRWLIDAIPTMDINRFTDHSKIDPRRKLDCGPLWPLLEINELTFSRKRVRDMAWQEKEFLCIKDINELKKEVRNYLDITSTSA